VTYRVSLSGGLLGLVGLLTLCRVSPAGAEGVRLTTSWRPAPPPGMVFIPAGKFLMGASSGKADAAPKHSVKLPAYYMDRCEVTNEQYAAFIEETRHRVPSPAEGTEAADWESKAVRPGHELMPVCEVDWADADAYARWAGKALPTEAEWERAARGGDGRIYPWGNELDLTKCNHDTDGPTDVGSFPEGVSPFGCLDMAGNVCEWTASTYRRYPGNPAADDDRDEEPYDEGYRVFRGGTWDGDCSYALRCYARVGGDPENRLSSTGFRCALSAPSLEAFEGVVLPEGTGPEQGWALIEALARAVGKWSGKVEDVRIAAQDDGRYEASLPVDGSGRVRYVLRCTTAGVWVAEEAGGGRLGDG